MAFAQQIHNRSMRRCVNDNVPYGNLHHRSGGKILRHRLSSFDQQITVKQPCAVPRITQLHFDILFKAGDVETLSITDAVRPERLFRRTLPLPAAEAYEKTTEQYENECKILLHSISLRR